MDTTYKTGTCRWCGDKTKIYRDNLLCDSCDDDTIYCHICCCRQHYESKCRHIFQNRHFEWRGAGVDPSGDGMERPFHRLLSAMGEQFARDLKTAIKSGEFYTFLVAPIIGGGGILEMHGMESYRAGLTWGDRLIKLGESARAEKFSGGYHWIASLYRRKTTKANRTTIAWIDRWLWPFAGIAAAGPQR